MSKLAHRVFIGLLVTIVMGVFILLLDKGLSYYSTKMDDRVFHPDNEMLKPSGILGHGYGIIGSFSILFGVGSYMARKRFRFLSRTGTLKNWLEFHIFLCTLGPVLILYHTSFKFGGIVAVSFWSMVAVFLSGIIGRFIYIQIPRTIEGRELSLVEVRSMKSDIIGDLKNQYDIDEDSFSRISESVKNGGEFHHRNIFLRYIRNYFRYRRSLGAVKMILRTNKLSRAEYRSIVSLVKVEINLNRKIEQLESMHKLFENWHVAHFPIAILMLVIMTIHVIVTVVFGYRWIF